MTTLIAVFVLSVSGAVPSARPALAVQVPLFRPAPSSPMEVGAASGQVILADLNGDGHLDMLTRHPPSQTLKLFIGDGRAGFARAPSPRIVLGYTPSDVVSGDLNHDGTIDFGVTSADRDIVDVFLGDGRGRLRLAPGSPFTASSAVQRLNKRGLHLADVNQDGKLDFVTENGRRNELGILLGDGRGGFSAAPTVTLDSDQDGYSSQPGDVDGDRHLDLVTVSHRSDPATSPSRLVVRRGDGTGAFRNRAGVLSSLPPDSRLLALSDLNGDSRPDVVLGHGNYLSILLNFGPGSFAPAHASPIDVRTEVFGLGVAEVSGDQNADLVAATVNSVTVLLGDGRGGLLPALGSPFLAGPGAYNLALGDVNEDGKLDVVASSFEGPAVTVLVGQ